MYVYPLKVTPLNLLLTSYTLKNFWYHILVLRYRDIFDIATSFWQRGGGTKKYQIT